MPADPKRPLVDGKHRLLTIHDGARLTPALVRMLGVIADEVTEHLDARLDEEQSGRGARVKVPSYSRSSLDPVLVSRSDGLAIYVSSDREVL